MKVVLDEMEMCKLMQRLFAIKNSSPSPTGIAMAPDPQELASYLANNADKFATIKHELTWKHKHYWWCWFWQKIHGREPNDYDGVCLNCEKDRYPLPKNFTEKFK